MTSYLISLIEAYKERIRNPLISSFLLSWMIFNWKIVSVYFFSDIPMVEKIQLIELKYSNLLNILVFPLLSAIFYILILPFIMWGIDQISIISWKGRKAVAHAQQMKNYEWKKKLAQEEAELQVVKSNNLDLQILNQEIANVRNQLEFQLELNREKEVLIRDLNEKLKAKPFVLSTSDGDSEYDNDDEISPEQKEFINNLRLEFEKFRNSNLYHTFSQVASKLYENKELEHELLGNNINALIAAQLIKKVRPSESAVSGYALTSLGKSFFLRSRVKS